MDQEILKQRYELILTSIGEGVYGLDKDGKTTFVNPAAEHMTGWSEDDLLGKTVHAYHHHSHADGSAYPVEECPVYRTVRDGVSRHIDNEVFWRKDGSQFPVEYVATPIMREGEILGAVIVFKDVSERRRAETDLRDAMLQVERLKEQLQAENRYLMDEIHSAHNFTRIVGNSPAIQQVLTQIEHVGPTDSSVLIQGESGTGKELVARAVHSASRRRQRPLVKVNCGAIAPGLVESELFGHEKGAFTGALQKRIGRFELADGGTIFLDELGERPLDLQAKLLRVLQEGELERIGEERTRKVNIRVIAATNRNLKVESNAGKFRQDLYYRLSVFPIELAPLRDRPEDIPLLARHFLDIFARKFGRKGYRLTLANVQSLQKYDWPGNIREMENKIKSAAIMAEGKQLTPEDLMLQFSDEGMPLNLREVRYTAEKNAIVRALGMSNNNISSTAKLLGVTRPTLYDLIKKHNIQIEAPADKEMD